MTLKEYFEQNKNHRLTQRLLAKEVGVGFSFISQLKNGNKKPSMITAQKIFEATKGAVRPEDFFDYN